MVKFLCITILAIILFGLISPVANATGIEDIPGETKDERVERLFFYISQWSREYSELEGPAIKELRSMGVEAVALDQLEDALSDGLVLVDGPG